MSIYKPEDFEGMPWPRSKAEYADRANALHEERCLKGEREGKLERLAEKFQLERDEARAEIERLRAEFERYKAGVVLQSGIVDSVKLLEELRTDNARLQARVAELEEHVCRYEKRNIELVGQTDRLREALEAAANELGVPQPGYPAPVANAAEILRAALDVKP